MCYTGMCSNENIMGECELKLKKESSICYIEEISKNKSFNKKGDVAIVRSK